MLVNMDDTPRPARAPAQGPARVADRARRRDWYRHISLRGRVVEIKPDTDCADIDRLSRHYRGQPYPDRDSPRTSAWIEIDIGTRWNVVSYVSKSR